MPEAHRRPSYDQVVQLPPMILKPRLSLKIHKEADSKAKLEASFLETPLSIVCKGDKKHFIHRAIIEKELDVDDQVR